MLYLPRFDEDTSPGTKEDHPTCIIVVVNEIQENDKLDEDICDDLEKIIQFALS